VYRNGRSGIGLALDGAILWLVSLLPSVEMLSKAYANQISQIDVYREDLSRNHLPIRNSSAHKAAGQPKGAGLVAEHNKGEAPAQPAKSEVQSPEAMMSSRVEAVREAPLGGCD
jgi:hypothetical protein